MIQNHTVLAIIPARGGSKGIPRKNLKMLAGKPLIAWTIEAALQSHYIDRLIVSSEDVEIIKAARAWGCEAPFTRPAELARDDTPGIAPVLHAVNTIKEKYDYILLLQPTSPLRTGEDIDTCLSYCLQEQAPACISVSEVRQSPYWMYTLNQDKRLRPLMQAGWSIIRRQDLHPVYMPNGAVYVVRREYLLARETFLTEKTLAYVMPPERSWDIDDETDFRICELILSGMGC